MAQTRFTLNQRIKPLADELTEITGVDSYSNLLSLLITKYGEHLKQTWRLLPTTTATPVIHPKASPTSKEVNSGYICELPEIDPVIARISGLIEDF